MSDTDGLSAIVSQVHIAGPIKTGVYRTTLRLLNRYYIEHEDVSKDEQEEYYALLITKIRGLIHMDNLLSAYEESKIINKPLTEDELYGKVQRKDRSIPWIMDTIIANEIKKHIILAKSP